MKSILVRAAVAAFATLAALAALAEPASKPARPSDDAGEKTIRWSDREWTVRQSTGGPGPNRYVRANVSVDADGALHLWLRERNGVWTCAEILSVESMGRGTYSFDLTTPADTLDPNVVLGLFNYPDAGIDGTREIDIEYSRWGKPDGPNCGYTAYPLSAKIEQANYQFTVHPMFPVTHRFVWGKDKIDFSGEDAAKAPIEAWSTPASFAKQIGNEAIPVHLNLWLRHGKPPTDGKMVELVVKSFHFTAAKRQ